MNEGLSFSCGVDGDKMVGDFNCLKDLKKRERSELVGKEEGEGE